MPARSPRPERTRGYLALWAATAVFATTAIFIRHLTERYGIPAGVLSFWRAVFLCGSLAPLLALSRPLLLVPRRRDLAFLAAQGSVIAIFNLLWTTSVARCGAALATVLVYSSCAFTALLGFFFLGERLSRLGLLAVGLCLAGSALVSGVTGGPLRADAAGVATGLLSGLAYAVYSVLGRAAARRGQNPWTTLLHAFAVSALLQILVLWAGPFLVPAAPGPEDLFWLGRSAHGWLVLLCLSAGPTLLGFGLLNVSLRFVKSGEASLVLSLEPALTALIAYALLGERMTATELAGSAVILSGIVVLNLGERRAAAPSPGGAHLAGRESAAHRSAAHPAKNANPPSGVTAPNARIPVHPRA